MFFPKIFQRGFCNLVYQKFETHFWVQCLWVDAEGYKIKYPKGGRWGVPAGAKCIKDLALLQLWHRLPLQLGFNPWPRNFYMLQGQQKRKKKFFNKNLKIKGKMESGIPKANVGAASLPLLLQLLHWSHICVHLPECIKRGVGMVGDLERNCISF